MSSPEHDHVATDLLAALAMGDDPAELGPRRRRARPPRLLPQLHRRGRGAARDPRADRGRRRYDADAPAPLGLGGRQGRDRPPGRCAGSGARPGDLARQPRRGVPTWLATVAATVALAAGVGLGAWVVQPDEKDDATPQAQVLGEAPLASLDAAAEDRGAAVVRRADDHLVLHVEASDLGGPDGTREVWLINVDGKRMVSLGLLPVGEAGDFDFPERLLDQATGSSTSPSSPTTATRCTPGRAWRAARSPEPRAPGTPPCGADHYIRSMTNLASLSRTPPPVTATAQLVIGDMRLSYAQLDQYSTLCASLLAARGIGPGDKVALTCPNLPYFTIAYYGILKAGATVVPLNVLLKGREVAYHLADSEAKAYFCFEGTPAAHGAGGTPGSRPPTRASTSS
ncbi:AMP-binding protein [Nocardioides daphniae]|uniref:AMP-binding protein n=1 Tax=Nocardioides daphniae TaxID=402297 RepID=UPI001EE980CA|nr:AMP-binding protein [Nocardioides daphniae]